MKAIFSDVPGAAQLYPVGDAGDVYYTRSGTVSRLDRQGHPRWTVEGVRVGVSLMPTLHNVVAMNTVGDVAVLDGTSGTLLACASGAGPFNTPVVNDDTVTLVSTPARGPSPPPTATATTSLLRFDPQAGGGFRTFGKVPGGWTALAEDIGTVVLGGHLALNSGTAVTRLAWVSESNPAGAATASRCATTVDGQRAADPGGLTQGDTPDNYATDRAGSDAAGCRFTGPVSARPAGTPQIWAGVDVIGTFHGLTIVRDGYARDVSTLGQPGGIAALDSQGRIRWRAAGTLQSVLVGSRIVEVHEAARGLAFTIIDVATGRTVGQAAVPDKLPGVRSMVAARGYSWTYAASSAVLVASDGKYATAGALGTDRQVIRFAASPASSQAVVTLAATDGQEPAQSYVVGP